MNLFCKVLQQIVLSHNLSWINVPVFAEITTIFKFDDLLAPVRGCIIKQSEQIYTVVFSKHVSNQCIIGKYCSLW